MILSKRVALGGVQLDEIHERIVVQSVDAGVPHEEIQAVNRMGGFGQRMTSQHWETLDVVVTYGIDVPKEDMATRRQILEAVIDMTRRLLHMDKPARPEAVNSWALRKGWLTVNFLPNRRMWVEKVILPSAGSLWDWTNSFSITFRSYGVPFWQDETATQITSNSITNGRVWIEVPGQFRTVANITFRNISGMTIPNITVNAGGSAMALNGINLGGSETLTIDHTNDGLLRITAGSRNVYGCRAPASADDLYLEPGSRAIDISTTRAGRLTVAVFGRYA